MQKPNKAANNQLLLRKCHFCGHINESKHELEECQHCSEPFLPLRYMEKIHEDRTGVRLYEKIQAIDEKDIIKGLYVLW